MKLIFHGQLKKLYGECVEMDSRVPADAIEGFFSQQANHPRSLVIEAVGFETEDKLKSETDAKEIHLIPAMFGGGGFGKILLGGALLAAAIFIPGIGAVLGGILKTALISIGASLVLQGVTSLFFKAPTSSKDGDPPPSKYLGNNTNTVEQGTPITVACGRVVVPGHWLSLQVDADKLAMGVFPTNPT